MFERYIPQEEWTPVEPQEIPHTVEGGGDGFLGGLLRNLGMTSGEKPSEPLFPGIPILDRLDSGDLLLMLLLYAFYRETEDPEWLIILGLVLLTG